MKKIALLSLVLGFAFQAQAREAEGSIDCVSLKSAMDVKITVKADNMLLSGPNEGTIWKVIVTATESDNPVETGRIDYLSADKSYKPRKYKNHMRFDLSKLTDTKSFGRFLPMDTCTLNFLVPEDGLSKKSFTAPMIINCDQNGGTISLKCDVTKKD